MEDLPFTKIGRPLPRMLHLEKLVAVQSLQFPSYAKKETTTIKSLENEKYLQIEIRSNGTFFLFSLLR